MFIDSLLRLIRQSAASSLSELFSRSEISSSLLSDGWDGIVDTFDDDEEDSADDGDDEDTADESEDEIEGRADDAWIMEPFLAQVYTP